MERNQWAALDASVVDEAFVIVKMLPGPGAGGARARVVLHADKPRMQFR